MVAVFEYIFEAPDDEMNFEENDEFLAFLSKMRDSTDYLGIEVLQDQYSYKICARNAYVGVWVKSENAFLISRYKVGPNPCLFLEYHWDIGTPLGTVKPIALIEKCPFTIKEAYDDSGEEEILNYLDWLEENNPIIRGYNSLRHRKLSAINFQQKLAGKQRAFKTT